MAAAPLRDAERGVPARLRRRRPRRAGPARPPRAPRADLVLRRARPGELRRRRRPTTRPATSGTPATDQPVEPEPTPGGTPTTEQLLDWPYTRTDLAWPADDTVAVGDLGLLRRGRAHDGDPRPRQRRADRGVRRRRRPPSTAPRALVADARPHRAAARGIRCLDRHRMAAGDRASCSPSWPSTPARRARPCSPRSTGAPPRRSARVAAVIDAHRRIGLVLARRPLRRDRRAAGRRACWSTCPRPTSDSRWSGAPSRPRRTSPSSQRCSTDPRSSPGPRAASSCRCSTWPGSPTARRGTSPSPTGSPRSGPCSAASRSCRAAPINVVSTETGVPTTDREHAALSGHRGRRRRPLERPAHRRRPGRGHRRAPVPLHGARARRGGRRQRRGVARGLALLHVGRARSATPS